MGEANPFCDGGRFVAELIKLMFFTNIDSMGY